MQHLYIVQHNLSGKSYIGISNNPARRFKFHVAPSSKTSLLSRAIHKYGKENFTITILESYETREEVVEAEKWMISYLWALGAVLYNIAPGGECPPSWTGKKRGPPSQAHRDKLRAAKLGKRRSWVAGPETRAKLSAANAGKSYTDAHRENIRRALTGRKLSPVHKAAISKTHQRKKSELALQAEYLSIDSVGV